MKLLKTILFKNLSCIIPLGIALAAALFAVVTTGMRDSTAAAPRPASCGAVTSTSDSGAGSLRSILACAPSGATITFDPATFSTPQTITLTSGPLQITQSVVISGPGSSLLSLSGGNARRVFSMTLVGAVDLYGMTLRNARSASNGGAIYVGSLNSTLTLSETQLLSNTGGSFGGGIYSDGRVILVGSVVSGNVSSVYGGGIYAAASAFITGSSLTSNTSMYGGGVYSLDLVTITSTVFSDNIATSGDGGGFSVNGHASIAGSTFRGNRSGGSGGGFQAVYVTLIDSTFISNRAQSNGGGFSGSSNTLISGTSFLSNTAGSGGGFQSNAVSLVVNSVFRSNVAFDFQGGAFLNGTGPCLVAASTIHSNTGTTGGGGFWCGGSAHITSTAITNNTAGGDGGGLHTITASLLDVVITGNSSTTYGGGVRVSGISSVAESFIAENYSAKMGGGILSSMDLTISGSTIATNTTGELGGGVFTQGDLIVTATTFASNTSEVDGGGVFLSYADSNIHDSTFVENFSARAGGAIYAQGSKASIQNSILHHNSAGADGGAIYLILNSSWSVSNTSFVGNSAAASGGVAILSGQTSVAISNSVMASNTAGALGGAIYTEKPVVVTGDRPAARTAVIIKSPIASLSGVTLHGNSAAHGGAIANLSILTVTNSTIADNSATVAGGGLVLSGTARLVNVTVSSNSAPVAAGTWFSRTDGPLEFVNTLVAGAAADQCAVEAGAAAISSTNSIATDSDCNTTVVAFSGVAPLGRYGGHQPIAPLLPGSPAIDAGDPAACPAADQRGIGRIGTCDVGAFESREFRLNIVRGSGQSSLTGSAFSAPLVAVFASDHADPVGPGALLSVNSPTSGAALSPTSTSGVGDALGTVTLTLTAGNVIGSYPITLTARGVATPVVASMTNLVASQLLTLSISGGGAGSVSSTPAGLSCSTGCVVTFTTNSIITLTAAPAATSTFGGWSGACAGSSDCVVTMDQPRSIGAAFTAKSSDAGLSSLVVAPGALVPSFAANTLNYSVAVGNAVASFILTPTLSNAGASYTVTNAAGVCIGNACALGIGANTVTVTVRAADGMTVRAYVVTVTRAVPPTPTPSPTRTATPTAMPSPTPTAISALFVSPKSGPVTTSTVSIIGSTGSGFAGITGVFVNGVKMFHVVRSDRKIDFSMKPGVAGATVDVVIVRTSGILTVSQAYTFEAPTSKSINPQAGGVLTTPNGVTITVPGQIGLRTAEAEAAGNMIIAHSPIDQPAAPPGDVPLSFFTLDFSVDETPVTSLANAATLEVSVDTSHVPSRQQAWLYEWVKSNTDPTSGSWQLTLDQSYDSLNGRLTARVEGPGTFGVVSTAQPRLWLPHLQ